MKTRDWDRLAAAYAQEVCDIFVRDRKKIISGWLKSHGLLRGRKTVLDVGCGIGSFFKKYGRHFGGKTGTDHSHRMLQLAAARCRGLKDRAWLQADVQRLPPALHGRGDLVVCSNVITFVSPAAGTRAMKEVAQCAKPRGMAAPCFARARESRRGRRARDRPRPTPPRAHRDRPPRRPPAALLHPGRRPPARHPGRAAVRAGAQGLVSVDR